MKTSSLLIMLFFLSCKLGLPSSNDPYRLQSCGEDCYELEVLDLNQAFTKTVTSKKKKQIYCRYSVKGNTNGGVAFNKLHEFPEGGAIDTIIAAGALYGDSNSIIVRYNPIDSIVTGKLTLKVEFL